MPSTSGIIQAVENGMIVDTTASGNTQSTTSKDNSSLDKEAFLQLLVAQMKYQDPLEPASNTEYISQLATFSSLEEMQNLNATMTNTQASGLVGKQVVVRVTDSSGTTSRIAGNVDYTIVENGKTYLSIEGSLYNIEDLESVVDASYLEAIDLADTFKQAIANLPNVNNMTLDDKEKIEAARDAVNAMTGYQQGFLDSESLLTLTSLLEQLAKLEAAVGNDTPEEGTGTEETEDGGSGESEAGEASTV